MKKNKISLRLETAADQDIFQTEKKFLRPNGMKKTNNSSVDYPLYTSERWLRSLLMSGWFIGQNYVAQGAKVWSWINQEQKSSRSSNKTFKRLSENLKNIDQDQVKKIAKQGLL